LTPKRERGQSLLLLTVSLTAMFGLLALVVEAGWARFRQQAAQAAAEAAALAAVEAAIVSGKGNFPCGSQKVGCREAAPCPGVAPQPPADSLDHGCLYAAANGFRHGGRQTVALAAGNGSPAPTAPGVAVRYWVTATVSESLPQLFSAVLGSRHLTAAARATAGVWVNAENACMYVLDPAAPAALSASGTTRVTVPGCDVYVNSQNSSAITVGGNAILVASGIQVAGGYSVNGDAQLSPMPATGVPAMPDPFADLPAPSFGGCNYNNVKVKNNAVLQPGVYCGGIDINSQASVTFAPGIYILNGGGLQVSGGASAAGAGVMFYNTASCYTFGAVSISGGASVNFSAPDSGVYKGVLFFQDRNLTGVAENDFTGGSSMNLDGTIYLPGGTMKFAGGSDTEGPFTALVARRVTFTGNSKFKPDPTGERTGLARRIASLIE
jgi:hypothetical protein